MKNWNELKKFTTYTDGINIYKYIGIHEKDKISTIHKFEMQEYIWDEVTDNILLDDFGDPIYINSTIYIDSIKEKKFIQDLKEY